MQNITVKVCYKGKTLIVGKGITPIDEILKQLVKRFPEAEQNQSSLMVEYESGAQDLLSAYKLAEKENKRFIKVKFNYGQQMDQSFVSEKLNETINSFIDDSAREQIKTEPIKDLQEIKAQVNDHSEQASMAIDPLDVKQEGLENPIVSEPFFKKNIPESEQSLLVEPLNKLQEKENPKEEVRIRSNQEQKPQETQIELKKDNELKNPIDYSLLDKSFKNQEKKEVQRQNIDPKKKFFDQLFGFDVIHQKKKEDFLNSDAKAILEIVRKEFDSKISTLQAGYAELKLKYDDLASKYDTLLVSFGEEKSYKKEEGKIDPLKIGYQKVPEKDPEQKSILKCSVSNCSVEYYAEINEFVTIQEVQVGQVIQSRFRFKNVGQKKWPESLFAYQQHSQDYVPIKNLQPNESAIILLHTEKALRIGEKINKIYQLVYFDERNNVKKFGRQFGVSVRVIGPAVHPKPSIHQYKNSKGSDPTIKFREHINEIMQANKITGKTLYDVIGHLKEFNVNAQNYTTCETKALKELIRSFCP